MQTWHQPNHPSFDGSLTRTPSCTTRLGRHIPTSWLKIVELGRIAPGDHVLEIGCGSGQLTFPLARRGSESSALNLDIGLWGLAAGGVLVSEGAGPLVVAAGEGLMFPSGLVAEAMVVPAEGSQVV